MIHRHSRQGDEIHACDTRQSKGKQEAHETGQVEGGHRTGRGRAQGGHREGTGQVEGGHRTGRGRAQDR